MPDMQNGQDEEKKGRNTGLPFGLCKKYGITLSPNDTPK